jgi:BirA family biotin operon repressor/biotin-[acetyl-CoA-carboxylase] ligase
MRDDFHFDTDEICSASFIRCVEIHDSLPSTNDRARELAADEQVELPALIVAREQTAGRGRGPHTWWSADGALTFSALLDAEALGIQARSWPQLSLAVAVAVCDAIGGIVGGVDPPADKLRPAAAIRVGIKWPNDVMLDGGKVCGILIESPGGHSVAKRRLIVGIGINVNNSWSRAPREAGGKGIALCDATGTRHNLQFVMTEVLNAIHERIRQLATNDPRLPKAWQDLCWLKEQRVESRSGGNRIDGICQGIASDGTLIIENALGTHRITSGSVRVM